MKLAPIVHADERAVVLDLSKGATLCEQSINGLSVTELSGLIDQTMAEAGTKFSFGRYGEPRELYSNDNFATEGSDETRTIHMGIDVFCVAGTPIYTPLDATVEHIANNTQELDYGPVVILRHQDCEGATTFSLYGHLGMDVLDRLSVGQTLVAGEQVATVGAPPTNGNWPPHLHFQLINDLLGLGTDFPGVALRSQQDYWLGISPSPAKFFPKVAADLLEYARTL